MLNNLQIITVICVAFSVAACSQTTNQTQILGPAATAKSGDGIIDPATGRINQPYLDATFSLADIVAEQLSVMQPVQNLDPNDRRFIDAALDSAMAEAPGVESQQWRNPANDHTGTVDLAQTFIDGRAGTACALILHEQDLGGTRLKGDVTFCRSGLDSAWLRESVNWAEIAQPKPVTTSPSKKAKPAIKPAATTATNSGTLIEPANTAKPATNKRKITLPTTDGVPDGDGSQNLGGSLLEDQSPHIEAD